MIHEPMWVGLKWNGSTNQWNWSNGSLANPMTYGLQISLASSGPCGTINHNSVSLLTEKCSKKIGFICERQEDIKIFQKYEGYTITEKQNTLPISYSTFEFAKEECLFERTICTGIVSSQNQFYLVSGKQIFRSLSEDSDLFIKSDCRDGFYGKNCQFKCQTCDENICNPITGQCIPSVPKCDIDSPDPKCIEQVFTDLCPKKPQWYYFSKSCYYVENIKKDTWENARIACQGFKKTDLVKITNSREKMWVQYKGDDSWIGLNYYKRWCQYLWIDKTFSVFQNAWVNRQNRRYTASDYDCGIALKKYLSLTDCSEQRNWICKREEVVDLFTEHVRRAFYLPDGKASKYPTLGKAKDACLVLPTCTGVTSTGKKILMHTSMSLYNTGNTNVTTWIKSDCTAGRYGRMCERKCRECADGMSCNPLLGLCVDSVFCNSTDPTFTCENGILIGGRCPMGRNWIYWQGSCYYIHEGKQGTWQKARNMCRRYNNTDLVWITSKAEKKWLMSKLPKGDYWIGLHGNIFCTKLQWVQEVEEIIEYGVSWTFYWKCCIYMVASEGLMTANKCFWEALWICKKREEEAYDFHIFDGYFLPGVSKSKAAVKYKTLNQAFQHCRFRRKHCTGVQRIYGDFIISFTKRLVLLSVSMPKAYTAYIKSACAPGYYGPKCNKICTCSRTENCNPFNGQCADNEECDEDALRSDCEKGVIHLKCPKDPGWWYWKGNCYYIETNHRSTWKEAEEFCMSYRETRLLPKEQSRGEKVWLTTVIKNVTWIGTEQQKTDGQMMSTCQQMKMNGKFQEVDCSSLAYWICQRSIDTNVFWEYHGRILISPLESRMYKRKAYAESACLLEKQCTGISFWQNKYIPVTGKELILTGSKQDTAYMKTACSELHYGHYCQKKCPQCPNNRPCNGLTGKCAEDLKCTETDNLALCEFKMKSVFCYYSWIYFNSYCYFIPKYGKINKSDAEYMCSQFKGAQLIDLVSYKEKDWLAKIISEQIWLRKVAPVFLLTREHFTKEGKMAQKIPVKVDLCLQLVPKIGQLLTVPCFYNASWVCKAPKAAEQVDAREKWWLSMVTSLIATVIVLFLTVLMTITYGFQISAQRKK